MYLFLTTCFLVNNKLTFYSMNEDSKAMTELLSRVIILTTGGTIQNDLSVEGYLSGEELVSRIPEIQEKYIIF